MMNPATQYRQDSRLALFAYSPPFSLPPFSLPPLSLPPLPLCHPHYLADDGHTHEDQHLVLGRSGSSPFRLSLTIEFFLRL